MKKFTKLINKKINRLFKRHHSRKDYENDKIICYSIDIQLAKIFGNIHTYIIKTYENKGNGIIIFPKESKDILNIQNAIKKYELKNVWCSTYSCYQLEYFHHHCSGRDFNEYKKAGCFDCLSIFDSKLLEDEDCQPNDYLVICPYCYVDSVLYEPENFKLTKDLLFWMKVYWFYYSNYDGLISDYINIKPLIENDYSVYQIYDNSGEHELCIEKYKNELINSIKFKNDDNISIELSDNRKKLLDNFFEIYKNYLVQIIDVKDYSKIDLFHYTFFKDLSNEKMLNLRSILINYLNENKSFQFEYDNIKILIFRKDEIGILGLGDNDHKFFIRTLNQFIDLNNLEK